MVTGAELKRSARKIEEALRDFGAEGEKVEVQVFESSPGLLRAVIGSDRFKAMGPVERQDVIWKYLKEHVAESDLHPCWGVHPMNLDEYYGQYFGESSPPPDGGGG